MKMNICRCAVGRKARIIVGTHNSRTDCSQRSIIKPCDFQVNIGYTEMVWRNEFGKQTLRSCVYFLSLTLHKCGGYKSRPSFPDMLELKVVLKGTNSAKFSFFQQSFSSFFYLRNSVVCS